MIKIIYKQDNYHYDNIGGQPYDIKTSINIIKDANVTECMEAFIKILKIATYPISRENLINAIEEIYEDGHLN